MHLAENKKGSMGDFGGRTVKREMMKSYYNLKT